MSRRGLPTSTAYGMAAETDPRHLPETRFASSDFSRIAPAIACLAMVLRTFGMGNADSRYRAASLKEYIGRCDQKHAVVISGKDPDRDGKVLTVPLYSIWMIFETVS